MKDMEEQNLDLSEYMEWFPEDPMQDSILFTMLVQYLKGLPYPDESGGILELHDRVNNKESYYDHEQEDWGSRHVLPLVSFNINERYGRVYN